MKRAISRRQFLHYFSMGSAAALLAACQPTPTPAPPPTKAAAPTAAPASTTAPVATAVPKATTVPATKQPLTISYWVELNSNVAATCKNYGEMTCYKELEKRTGVKVEFQHPPTGSGQALEQFNLIVASGKYPDVIEYGWLGAPGGPSKYIKEKVIHKLNDIIDKQSPNLKKVLTDHPDWRKQVNTDDGEMFVFPFLRGDPFLLVFYGPVARGDWMEKLKIQTPKTLDDWHTMLLAFKQKDPNGNGKADEIPFTLNRAGGKHTSISNGSAFVGAWGIAWEWYHVNNVVKYGPLQPEFKEFLTLLAGWYKDGLIDPEYISADKKAMDAKWTNHQLGSGCEYTGSGIGYLMGLMKGKDPNFKVLGLPYPVLKAGDKPLLGQRDNVYTGVGAAITTACKRVDDVAQWLDYAYGPEGHMLFNFGVEGTSYTMVNGYPTYTADVMRNPKGLPVNQGMGQHARSNHNGPFVQDRRYMEQYSELPEQKAAITTWTEPSNERLMPPVTATQDESKKFASVMNDVRTRFEEAFDKIVTGAEPVSSWDAVIGQFKQMGMDEAVKIRQAGLDRYNKR